MIELIVILPLQCTIRAEWRSKCEWPPEIVLTSEEPIELTKLVRSKLSSVWLAQRARIVLLAAEGMQNKAITQQLGVGRVQVARWRGPSASRTLA